jgi:Polyketide cyclase / dehydrase and lipid transport
MPDSAVLQSDRKFIHYVRVDIRLVRHKEKNIMKKVLLALLIIVAVLAIIVAFRPSEFSYSRSATISAPAAKVFALVHDFHEWEAWSPWAKLDTNAVVSFEGPSSGVGATFRWAGNKEVGEGSQTIIESELDQRIAIRLEFLKPFQATNYTEFQFEEKDGQTTVTWNMTGNNNFMGKLFSLFGDCDAMIGSQFEQGLANMKSIAESSAAR